MLEHSLRFHKNLDRPKIDDSLLSIHRIAPSTPTTPLHEGNMSPLTGKRVSIMSNTFSSDSSTFMSMTGSAKVPPILPFDDDEAKEFLICFVYLLQNLHSCMYCFLLLIHFTIWNIIYKLGCVSRVIRLLRKSTGPDVGLEQNIMLNNVKKIFLICSRLVTSSGFSFFLVLPSSFI